MASKIEEMIEEIQDYIDSCKFKRLSSTTILVDKETIDDLLRELRMKTPEEIKRYQKIIRNQEDIMNDAKSKAAQIVQEANEYTNAKVTDSEITQQAYVQAQMIVDQATEQAQNILDNAVIEANSIRESAMQYTDGALAGIENLLVNAMETCQARHDSLMSNMQTHYQSIVSDRAQLHPEEPAQAAADTKQTSSLNADMLN